MKITVEVEAEFLASYLKSALTLDLNILEEIEPGYFSVDSYQWLVKQLKERKWEVPAFGAVDQLLLEDVKDDEKLELWRRQLYGLYTRELTFTEDAEKKFKTFISYSILKATTKESFENFDRTGRMDFCLNDMTKACQAAQMVIRDDQLPVVDWAENYEARTERRIMERDNPDINPVIMTGIPGIDVQFKIKAPMVVDFFAPFKRYKSIVLNHMAFASLMQGFNVLQVVYENTIELTEDRLDALFAQLSYDRITGMVLSQGEKDQLGAIFKWANSWGARLKIMKCDPKHTKITEVVEYIEKLKMREGWAPDVVIVDYLNIVAPTVKHGQERLDQGQIVWDIKSYLADHYNVPVITATQAKMEAVNAERLDQSHRGKSIDISQGVNLSIAINQTPEEKADDIVVFSPLFSRESEITDTEVAVNSNMSKMMITRDLSPLWNAAYRNFSIISS